MNNTKRKKLSGRVTFFLFTLIPVVLYTFFYENALFGLFAVDTAEFTADNAYMTAVSDENGHFEFDKIPYGEYIVREIEAPTGYILSDESYPVTISEDGEIIEITAVNKPITIEISKQDIYGNELVGAKNAA